MLDLVIAVAAGALIGLSLGALGGGGSILAVPVLVYALGQSPTQATTGSLVVVGVTALTGAVTAYRSGNVLLARGVTFGLVAIGGAALGAKASALVSEAVLLAAFAMLMLVVGGLMAVRQVRAHRASSDHAGDGHDRTPQVRRHGLDDPDHHVQPDIRLPMPPRSDSADHRHCGRVAHRPSSVSAAGSWSCPPCCSRSRCRWSTPPAPRWWSSR